MIDEEGVWEDKWDDKRDAVVMATLESFAASRSPVPTTSVSGNAYVPDHMTTRDIVDLLAPIVSLMPLEVSCYLIQHNYHLMTAEDGTLRWEIWRDMSTLFSLIIPFIFGATSLRGCRLFCILVSFLML